MSQNIYSVIDKLYVIAEILEKFPNQNNDLCKITNSEILLIDSKVNSLLANIEKKLTLDQHQLITQCIQHDRVVMQAIFPFYWIANSNVDTLLGNNISP